MILSSSGLLALWPWLGWPWLGMLPLPTQICTLKNLSRAQWEGNIISTANTYPVWPETVNNWPVDFFWWDLIVIPTNPRIWDSLWVAVLCQDRDVLTMPRRLLQVMLNRTFKEIWPYFVLGFIILQLLVSLCKTTSPKIFLSLLCGRYCGKHFTCTNSLHLQHVSFYKGTCFDKRSQNY